MKSSVNGTDRAFKELKSRMIGTKKPYGPLQRYWMWIRDCSTSQRFVVLDAWRGLSASLVALFHLQAYSHLYNLSLLRHSFLFVDFFFVLSGFVITANYRHKLLSGFPFWEFMLLRLGRLYPLHFAILIAFVALELIRYQFNGAFGGELGQKFYGPNSVEAIFTNILLIQGLHVHDGLTWNMPSWSISVEFYTYAIFAIFLLVLKGWIYALVLFIVVAAPISLFILVGHIDAQYDFGLIRCVLGFFVGFFCFDVYMIIKRTEKLLAIVSATEMEIICAGVVILFVSFCGDGTVSLAAPAAFGFAVITFSFEGGLLSKALKARPFVFLGALSYSIYMTHMLVQLGMRYTLQLTEKITGMSFFSGGTIGAEMWQGDIAYPISLALVVAVSYLTYNFIEQPGRRHTRKLAKAIFGAFLSPRSIESKQPTGRVTPMG
jgi:peptidoglycan/LPS O-acetylase OafA/YrhL